MKKLTLLTASVIALGSVGLTTGAQLAHADVVSPQASLNSQDPQVKDAGVVVLDKGEFVNPITMDTYDYSMNALGLATGKVVMEYDSKSLVTIALGEEKHFNLKLPEEFNLISGKNGGADLKNAITASYELPGNTDYTNFKPEDINTSYEGQIDFKLSATSIINIGQTTKIKIQIDYGKILDALGQGSTFDYKKIIPDSKEGGYTFKGVLTNSDIIDIWPSDGATGVTDNSIAAKSGTLPLK